MSIEIRRPIIPPDWPAFAERSLGRVHAVARLTLAHEVGVSLRDPDCAARIHELRDKVVALVRGEPRVRAAP